MDEGKQKNASKLYDVYLPALGPAPGTGSGITLAQARNDTVVLSCPAAAWLVDPPTEPSKVRFRSGS